MRLYLLLLISFVSFPLHAADAELLVLDKWLKFTDNSNALYHHFSGIAFDYLTQRKADIEKLHSQEDWQNRQRHVRDLLSSMAGPFPPKTPLNARITGVLKRPTFQVEKVIYESQPNFYVTACLFLPYGIDEKRPAVIYCSGHSAESFRSKTYQTVILNLVQKGFIVFAFDPIGQGERLQYWDEKTNSSAVGGPTKEHSYAGAQMFIAGGCLANVMIWDGIRAIDYLLTRPEVDPDRLAITGRSGGGTQAAYIAAFDERIYAAAPECYITNFTRLLQSVGPQDAEQHFPRSIAQGFDHADLIEVRAPKPTLLIGTTRDFFSIQGLQETFSEAIIAYRAFGQEENLLLAVDDSAHASTIKNREALYAFLQETLKLPGTPHEEQVNLFSREELLVTNNGQGVSELGGETLFSLHKKRIGLIMQSSEQEELSTGKCSTTIFAKADLPVVFAGRSKWQGILLEKYFTDYNSFAMPFIILRTSRSEKLHRPILFLSPIGKEAARIQLSLIKPLVESGHDVILPDLLGLGESGPGKMRGDSYRFQLGTGAYNIWFLGIQINRSIVATRAEQILALSHYLASRTQPEEELIAIADGTLANAAAQAVGLDTLIQRLIVRNSLASPRLLLENEYYLPELVHGIDPFKWQNTDYSDPQSAILPPKLAIINPLDQMAKPIDADRMKALFSALISTYARSKDLQLELIANCPPSAIDRETIRAIRNFLE